MSFGDEIRTEIVRGLCDQDRRYACLYGAILYTHMMNHDKIEIHTESEIVRRTLPLLMQTTFHVPMTCGRHENSLIVSDKAAISQILEAYHIDPCARTIDFEQISGNSLGSFLAGVFLVCGAVCDPEKEYHLEWVTPCERLCTDLQQFLLGGLGVMGKILKRRGSFVLYFKGSEAIEDILTFMGAGQCTIALINVKIHKDMRNVANRVRNCDEANINKVVNVSMRQVRDIRTIMVAGKYDEMSPQLREVAQIRLENPDLSLAEIGQMISPPLSRSGVNRRFQKIAAIAQKCRGN